MFKNKTAAAVLVAALSLLPLILPITPAQAEGKAAA